MVGNFCITAGLSGGRWPQARVNPSGSSPLVCKVPEVLHTSDAMLGGSSFSWSFGPNDLENKIKLTTSTLEVCGAGTAQSWGHTLGLRDVGSTQQARHRPRRSLVFVPLSHAPRTWSNRLSVDRCLLISSGLSWPGWRLLPLCLVPASWQRRANWERWVCRLSAGPPLAELLAARGSREFSTS